MRRTGCHDAGDAYLCATSTKIGAMTIQGKTIQGKTIQRSPIQDFRFPGVLNSKELLIAEAIQARAWQALDCESELSSEHARVAKERLGGIVVRLMAQDTRSIGDLAKEAVDAFKSPTQAKAKAPAQGTSKR